MIEMPLVLWTQCREPSETSVVTTKHEYEVIGYLPFAVVVGIAYSLQSIEMAISNGHIASQPSEQYRFFTYIK